MMCNLKSDAAVATQSSDDALMHMQVVTLDIDRQDPFVEEHIKPCARLWDALAPYRTGPDSKGEYTPRPVTDRVIFTDTPAEYKSVAAREALLAAALYGTFAKQREVHDVMQRHKYILTLDYTMKMLHLEVSVEGLTTCHCIIYWVPSNRHQLVLTGYRLPHNQLLLYFFLVWIKQYRQCLWPS